MFHHGRANHLLLTVDILLLTVRSADGCRTREGYGSAVKLVGAAETTELLGQSRQRFNSLVQWAESFRLAAAELKAGWMWLLANVEASASPRGRFAAGSGERL